MYRNKLVLLHIGAQTCAALIKPEAYPRDDPASRWCLNGRQGYFHLNCNKIATISFGILALLAFNIALLNPYCNY